MGGSQMQLTQGHEVSLERGHLARQVYEVCRECEAGATAPRERRLEALPGGLVAKIADRLEIARNGSFVLHPAALDNQSRVESRVLQPQMQQRPGGQCGERSSTATENRFSVIHVRSQRRSEFHVLDSG